MTIILRPYQSLVGQAIIDSVQNSKGLTFSVEIARQGGKNELSAILEMNLLMRHLGKEGSLIKASPTFQPQTVISMERLKQRLDDRGLSGSGARRWLYHQAEARPGPSFSLPGSLPL